MSSTKASSASAHAPEAAARALDERLRRFYRRRIATLDLPASQEGRARVGEGSFWIERDGSSPGKEDFELVLGDDLDMALTLELFWSDTVLSGLGTPLARLARRILHANRFSHRGEGEVSSFVYEMF